MRFSYLGKTLVRYFKNAWLSSFLAIFTIIFSLVLVGLVGLVWLNLHQLLESLRDQVQMQAYISNALNDEQIARLQQRVEKINGVQRLVYVTKSAAAAEFQQEFGKGLFDLLEENPLPASFSVYLAPEYRTETGIRNVSERIQGEAGIDEVVSHFKTLTVLNKYADRAFKVNMALFLFVSIGSLLLVANNIRLVIGSQQQIIETMRLVGATTGFIRGPLILAGVGQGVVGGLLALLFLSVAVAVLGESWSGMLLQGLDKGYWLIVAGGVWGALGSWIGVRRYLKG